MRPLDRTAMANKYPGKWVALKADRKTVVSVGSSVKQVLDEAHRKGYEHPVITKMPNNILALLLPHADRCLAAA